MFRPRFETLERRQMFSADPVAEAMAAARTETGSHDEKVAIVAAPAATNQDIEVENDETHWVGFDRGPVDYNHPDRYSSDHRSVVVFESQTKPHADGLRVGPASYLDDTDIVQALTSPIEDSPALAAFAGRYGNGDFAGFANTTFDDESASERTESVGINESITIGGARTEGTRPRGVAAGDVNGDGRADVVTATNLVGSDHAWGNH